MSTIQLYKGDCLEIMKEILDKSVDMILCDLPYGETILDNCIGSGSTGVAAVNTNRNLIGIELNDEYFEIAKQQIGSIKK